MKVQLSSANFWHDLDPPFFAKFSMMKMMDNALQKRKIFSGAPPPNPRNFKWKFGGVNEHLFGCFTSIIFRWNGWLLQYVSPFQEDRSRNNDNF